MTILRPVLAVLALVALGACAAPLPAPVYAPGDSAPLPAPEIAAKNFVDVVRVVEPVSEAECRRLAPQLNCDFQIVVDNRPGQPPNAFQSRDRTGRPVITFTLALIADARNTDELAFVMSHEAAHHIMGHLDRQEQNALAGALIFGGLASATGGSANLETAQRLGAFVGARSYSKDFELEADELGTVIAKRAGFDPLVGARFFSRIPDPGNRFLGTHPPNAERIQRVEQTVARLRG